MLVKVTTVECPISLFSSHLGGRDVWTEKPNYAWPEPRQVVAYEAQHCLNPTSSRPLGLLLLRCTLYDGSLCLFQIFFIQRHLCLFMLIFLFFLITISLRIEIIDMLFSYVNSEPVLFWYSSISDCLHPPSLLWLYGWPSAIYLSGQIILTPCSSDLIKEIEPFILIVIVSTDQTALGELHGLSDPIIEIGSSSRIWMVTGNILGIESCSSLLLIPVVWFK